MHRRHLLGIGMALLTSGLAGCLGAPGTNRDGITQAAPTAHPDISEDELADLVTAINAFAFGLYQDLATADPEENLFASPVSIAIALAMTYAGARSDTRDEMRDVLGLPDEDDQVHETFNALQRAFAGRGDDVDIEPAGAYDEDDDPVPYEPVLANSVWGQEGYGFDDDYFAILSDHYYGSLEEVDFAGDPDGTRRVINDWVADHTEDRIDELLPEGSIDSLVRLVLVNTIYFYANWLYPFEESQTEIGTFTAIDGTDHDVPIMHESRRWAYAEVDGTQAVELPYVGEEASMVVLLPPEESFDGFETSLDRERLEEIIDNLEGRNGSVELPHFEFETSVELATHLESMGMEHAFDPDMADFSGMVEEDTDLYLDNVYHDAFVKVDEEGTEAAAATAAVMRTTSAPADPFTFRADRPFVFVIRDNPTGSIVFVGRVVDPSSWE